MELYTYKAKVIDIYDGDTITVLVDLGFHINITEKVRLSYIDAPEVRGIERTEGLKSKKWLENKILDKWIVLKTNKDKKGKYGRYIAEIFIEDEYLSINEQMVNEGFAERYE